MQHFRQHPNLPQGFSDSFDDRFWNKVKMIPNGCWIWTGVIKKPLGYGVISRGKTTAGLIRAHVASWLLAGSEIPNGLDVCHWCDNPSCVRPTHLFIGTRKDNMRDAVRKGRTCRGEKRPNAKLTSSQVKEIRVSHAIFREPHKALAKRYRISVGTLKHILYWHTWKHVTVGSSEVCQTQKVAP